MTNGFDMSIPPEGVRTFDPPPDDFNPRAASNAELVRLGLPRHPNSEREASLAALWEQAFSRQIGYVRAAVEVDSARLAARRAANQDSGAFGPDNENWAGVVAPNLPGDRRYGGPLTGVVGQFTVPTVTLVDPKFPGSIEVACWVGLDGWGGIPSVLQAGVVVRVDPVPPPGAAAGVVQYQAFMEWAPGRPYAISNLPVSPGDVMTFVVCELDKGGGSILAENVSANVSTGAHVDAPAGVVLHGDSAEWIVEGNGGALADFGTAAFMNCVASNPQGQYAAQTYGQTTNVTNSKGVAATTTQFTPGSAEGFTVQWESFDLG